MKQASIDAHHYGPWMLYIPTAYETKLDEDYDATRGNTIRERIEAISGIQGVKVIDTLPANNVLLVQMSTDVVRLIKGTELQNVEWQTEGKFITKYKTLMIQVPQIRSDQDGNTGIVHLA
jgi:ABC-type sulfate transport system substrate-binding protein